MQFHDLTDVPADQRGHSVLGRSRDRARVRVMTLGDEPLTEGFADVTPNFECARCDDFVRFDLTESPDGYALTAQTACELADGVDIEYELAVPSGRIVVADDLRPVYDVDLPGRPSLNSDAGKAALAQDLAEIGCAYGFVGNTCPSLIRTGPDRYVIASRDDDAAPGEEGHLAGKDLAHVCTDLWAFCIADHDDYQARAAAADRLPHGRVETVDLAPGVYRFRVHSARAGFETDACLPVVFADVELVRPL